MGYLIQKRSYYDRGLISAMMMASKWMLSNEGKEFYLLLINRLGSEIRAITDEILLFGL